MRTHRERDIAKMDDRTLMNYIYSHLDRAQDRNSGAQNNLFIASFPNLSEAKKDEKLTAVAGYLIQIGEDFSALRLATKNFHKRLLKTKRQVHNMGVQFEKVRGERTPTIEDVVMPDLWNVGEFTVTHKPRENKKCHFLREDGGCDLGPKDGCIFTTEDQMCGQPDSPTATFRVRGLYQR